MAKKIKRIAKLEFMAGQAKPGPELAGLGIVMPEFTKQFNDQTRERSGEPVPVVITIYDDKSFTFQLKTAPTAFKIKQAAGIKSGASNSKTDIAGKITAKQLTEIAEYKLVDLNTNDIEAAKKQVSGTAKNMGVLVEGVVNIAKAQAAAKEAQKDLAAANAAEATLAAEAQAAVDNKDAPIEVKTIAQGEEESNKTSEGDK
ncbi:MAG: 50S ribosomal protein L11 [Mycoplasma sp.]|nr:50S ribosomal protein L11 [Mycoplasma sp.]